MVKVDIQLKSLSTDHYVGERVSFLSPQKSFEVSGVNSLLLNTQSNTTEVNEWKPHLLLLMW